MTSFGYRLNPRYAIKKCSSCGTLYTRDCSCSKGNVEDKILVPKPPKNCARCARCGHPVNGPHCQGCTLLREKLEEDLVTYFQNFQNTSKSSDGSTNDVNAPREPFVVKQDLRNSHNKAHKRSLVDIEKSRAGPHTDHNRDTADAFENRQYKPENIHELFCKLLDNLQNIHEELAEFINSPGWNRPVVYDDDDDDMDYTIAITPVLSTKEPDHSLSMGEERLDTILATESDDVEKIVIPKDEEIEDDNLQEISSGSTTTHSAISLLAYEAFSFYDDHIEEISSGSTTTQSDISLPEYDSFIFDLSNDQFPPTDRSDLTHVEFCDEPAHIISSPEYDCFYFGNLPDL
nr:hypothetical protein [Tanacetum cinerariifolium]